MKPRAVVIAALALVLVTGASEGRQVSKGNPASPMYRVSQDKANRGRPCSGNRHYEVHHWMTPKIQHRHVEALIGCAVDRWAVPGGYDKALSVARCESSLYAFANNGHGDLGVYQISSWETRARYWLKRWWFPHHPFPPRWALARANVLLAIRWAHREGWSAWACA